jgi:hypothetical protein
VLQEQWKEASKVNSSLNYDVPDLRCARSVSASLSAGR